MQFVCKHSLSEQMTIFPLLVQITNTSAGGIHVLRKLNSSMSLLFDPYKTQESPVLLLNCNSYLARFLKSCLRCSPSTQLTNIHKDVVFCQYTSKLFDCYKKRKRKLNFQKSVSHIPSRFYLILG